MSHLNVDHSASDLGWRQIKSQNVAALSAFFLVFNLLVAVSASQRLHGPIPPSSKVQSVQEKREAVGGADQVDQTISLRLRYAPQNPTAPDLAATLILQRKGRALDAASENLNSLRNRFDPEDHALLDQLTSTRSQLARLVFAGPRRMTAEQYWGRIKAPEDQTEKAETQVISLYRVSDKWT